jgi:hypothetical protein
MLDDATELLEHLKQWTGPIRVVRGEGAHVLINDDDHTVSSIATYEAWDQVLPHLSSDGEDLYRVA